MPAHAASTGRAPIAWSSAVRPILCLLVALLSPAARPDEAVPGYVHWAYAAYFGSGWYDLEGQDAVLALSYGPRWQWREPALHADGRRRLGIEFRFPFSASLHRFDLADLPGLVAADNVGTLSAVPGVEIEIPVTPRWRLKPVAHVGGGTALGEQGAAWIYWGGIKSQLRLSSGDTGWTLVNSAMYVGYTPETGPSGRITPLLTGVEYQQRTRDWTADGEPLYVRWHAAYTRYGDFGVFDSALARDTADIDDELEFGAAINLSGRPLRWRFLSFEQLGLTFRYGSGGGLRGLSLNFRSLFDR